MAIIRPFRAIRPHPDYAAQVACLPYDVLSSAEAQKQAEGKPYSFLHVEKAEIDCPAGIDLVDPSVYAKARENLDRLIALGVLRQDREACFYIYRETFRETVQTGVVACTPIDEYLNGSIKVHEQTRPDKVQERMQHMAACDAQTGLIFLAYRQQPRITALIEEWMTTHASAYDFASDDGVSHTLWVLSDPHVIQQLTEAFRQIATLYIADGHHRTAAAVQFGQHCRQRFPHYNGTEEFNSFLSVLFPHNQLTIMDYNRVVKDLHGLSETEFLDNVRERFEVELWNAQTPYRPTGRHMFGMYLSQRWYCLTARPGTYHETDPVESLDSFILQANLLHPILGIADPRTDKRIEFVGGIRGLHELERCVEDGMRVAFALYPVAIDEVLAVADAGQMMPPKSTWFEPKLRSGLVLHKFDIPENREESKI